MAISTLPCTGEHELEEDWEVEAQLRAVAGDQWSELWAIANQIAELEVPGVWDDGNVIGHTADGHNIYDSLYIVYAEPVVRFIRLWDEMGLLISYGTLFLDHPDVSAHAELLEFAPIADAVRFGSAVIGLERFGNGVIGEAIETGAFAAMVQRLKVWKMNPNESAEGDGSAEFAAWLRAYRDSCRWRAAKSGAPQEYTIRDWRPEADEEFERAADGIREFGYSQAFYGSTYIYFNLDGFKYWTMGDPLAETTVLNRDPIENRYES